MNIVDSKDMMARDLLALRVSVGFLGERAQYGWWPTAFYEPSSRRFLEPVFPKTFRLAQYQGVLEAARRVHDEHLNVGSYHLFRLPEEYEQDLHHAISSGVAADNLAQAVRTKEDAMSVLRLLSGNRSTSEAGPQAIGSIGGLDSATTLEAMAAGYIHGFQSDVRVYPYLGRL